MTGDVPEATRAGQARAGEPSPREALQTAPPPAAWKGAPRPAPGEHAGEDRPETLRSGEQVAGYQVGEQIGEGGMAVVYRAFDEQLDRPVALKVLAPRWAKDRVFRQRFIGEANAAAAVGHPNVIPVYRAGDADGTLFIAMRMVTGGDLKGVLSREGLARGGLPAERVLGLLEPVAAALDAAHSAGLVHRDVKPANILLDPRPGGPDHVYVADFGFSKGAVTGGTLTPAGGYLGTPHYSSPEQAEGKPVDGRADQYSLACVAFELLSGRKVFERDQVMRVLLAHLSADPPALSGVCPGMPEAADAVLARALAKAPADRYPSCAAFLADLRTALTLPPGTLPPGSRVPGSPQRKRRGRDRLRTWPAPAVLTAGAVVLAAAIAIPLALHATPAPRAVPARPPHPAASHTSRAVAVPVTKVTPGSGALLDTLTTAGLTRVAALAFTTAPAGTAHAGKQPDTWLAVVGSGSDSITVWDTTTRKVAETLTDRSGGGFQAVAVGDQGKVLAAVRSDGRVDVWDTRRRVLEYTITDPPAPADLEPDATTGVTSVAVAADGTVATGDNDGNTYLWNEPGPDPAITLGTLGGLVGFPAVTSVAFAPDGTLAAGYADGEIFTWDAGDQLPTGPADYSGTDDGDSGSAVTSLAWSKDGEDLAIGHANGQAAIYSWSTTEPAGSFPVPGGSAVSAVGWTTDAAAQGMLAVGAANGTTYVWDLTNKVTASTDAGPRGVPVTALSFAPDGTTMAVGGSDGAIRLWHVTPYQPVTFP